MDLLLDAVRTKNQEQANEWASGDQWSTVVQLLAHADSATMANRIEGARPISHQIVAGQPWTCAHCTFINPTNLTSCEICNLPHQI